MALASTYDEWVALVRDWLDIDDLSDAQIGTCLSLAQIRLNREMESYEQEKQYTYIQRDAAKVSRHLSDFGSDWFTLVGTTLTFIPVLAVPIPFYSIAPSVYTSGWHLIENTNSSQHAIEDFNDYTTSIPVGSTFTASLIVRNVIGSRDMEFYIGTDDASSYASIQIDAAGNILLESSAGCTVLDSQAIALGNGYFRLCLSVSGFSSSWLYNGAYLVDSGSYNYPGDGNSQWTIQHYEIELVAPVTNVDNYSLPMPMTITDHIADFNKIRLFVPGPNIAPMDVLATNEFAKLQAANNKVALSQGFSGFFSIDANVLNALPVPVDGSYVTIYYYFEVTPISPTVDSNIFTQFYSDALLWAACIEASGFIVEDERAAMYEGKYQNALAVANNKPKRIRLGSTPLKRQITMYRGNQ